MSRKKWPLVALVVGGVVAMGRVAVSGGGGKRGEGSPPAGRPSAPAARETLKSNAAGADERLEALRALREAPSVDEELLELVADVSRQGESQEVKVAAIDTLGVWMGRHAGLVEEASRLLVRTLAETTDLTVRGHAVQAIALHEAEWPDDVMDALASFLQDEEENPADRAIAALGLGGAQGHARPFALAQLRQAYERASDVALRRQLLTHIVRAAGTQARAMLAKLPADHELLAQDVRDYLEILKSGTTDAAAIYGQKFQRDARRGTLIGADRHQD